MDDLVIFEAELQLTPEFIANELYEKLINEPGMMPEIEEE